MADVISHPLIGIIRERGLIDDMQLEEVTAEHERTGRPFNEILVDYGLIENETQLQLIAEYLGTEVVNLGEVEFTPELVEAVPAATARMYQCLPVSLYGDTLRVALVDPLNAGAVDELGFSTGKQVQVVVADPAQITKLIEKHYPQETGGMGDLLKELGLAEDIGKEVAEVSAGTLDLANLAGEAPIIKFVNLVLLQAIQDRASDIHFEPFEDEFKIRYRVDGALYEMSPPPKHLALPVTSRLKILANLDISERRLPQDGRISMNISGRQVDLRV